MKVINFSEQNTVINQYLAELRDKKYQQNRLLFRNNIERIGKMMAYELSKTLDYKAKRVTTPLGTIDVMIPVPMLATGGSMAAAIEALSASGKPKTIHIACVIAAPEGIEVVKEVLPDYATIWCAAIDPGMNEHKNIVPGFGDCGDLCYGEKL